MDDDFLLREPPSHRPQLYAGLGRLLCAALADPVLAQRLLRDPATTLEQQVSPVVLSTAERALALPIQDATDIHDFAERLYVNMQQAQRIST